MTLLGSIAEIRMGATLRGRDATRPDPNGAYRLLRIGDLSDDGRLLNSDLPRIRPNKVLHDGLCLRPDDVVFANRGRRTTPYVFRLPEPNVIVGAQFFVLRPDPVRMMPEFLAWYLRSEEAAAHFANRRKGTLVAVLQRRDLAELPVPVPDLPIQRRIAELAELADEERVIVERLAGLRRLQLNRRLIETLHPPDSSFS